MYGLDDKFYCFLNAYTRHGEGEEGVTMKMALLEDDELDFDDAHVVQCSNTKLKETKNAVSV